MQSSPEALKGVSRAQRIKGRGGVIEMPHLGFEKYLVSIWKELGYCDWSGDQPVQFSASELQSWSAMSAKTLLPWEFRVIRKMAREFGFQVISSRDEDCPAPYGDPEMQFDRGMVSKGLRSFLQSFNRKKQS